MGDTHGVTGVVGWWWMDDVVRCCWKENKKRQKTSKIGCLPNGRPTNGVVLPREPRGDDAIAVVFPLDALRDGARDELLRAKPRLILFVVHCFCCVGVHWLRG